MAHFLRIVLILALSPLIISSGAHAEETPLYNGWNAQRADEFATTGQERWMPLDQVRWSGTHVQNGPSSDGYRLYCLEGLIFQPRGTPPEGIVPLYSWFNASTGDYLLSSHPERWARPQVAGFDGFFVDGPQRTILFDDGYNLRYLSGYVYDPRGARPPRTVPLFGWWNEERGDYLTTSEPYWRVPSETLRWNGAEIEDGPVRDGYRLIRLEMFQALDRDSRLSTGLRTGEIAGLRLFTERVAPLVAAARAKDEFAVMAHLRATSPLLERSAVAQSTTSDDPLLPIRTAVNALLALNPESPATTFLAILECVAEHRLFEIPAALRPFVSDEAGAAPTDVEAIADEEGTDTDEEATEPSPASLEAWRAFLVTPYCQTVPYAEYVSNRGPFGTHQGVKGLEFERVLVVLDDSDARGFLFSYEKLFEAKPLSDTDRKHLADATDGGITRTRRLLYVTSTRVEKSLALVTYTEDPDALIAAVLRNEWFASDEVERL